MDDGELMRLTAVLHTRLQQMEDVAARKVRDLYNLLRQEEQPLRELLQCYFELGALPPSVPDAAARCFVRAQDDRFARGEIATLLHSVALASGKEVARVLHGIRGEDNALLVGTPGWGKARHLEYRSLVELANQMILQRVQD